MLTSIDPFLSRRRQPGYDCRDFVREVWKAHTGAELGELEPSRMGQFTRLATPHDPCIVLFRRRNENHIGVYLRGKVLHLAEAVARFERLDLAGFGFSDVRFYR